MRRRWKAADHDQRRELIANAALDLLQKHGPAALTMRRVAQRLGVGAMTLYTYFNGQDELRRELTRRGFLMLHAGCENRSTLDAADKWLGGARAYLQFAVTHPNLYKLMFEVPLAGDSQDQEILRGGFHPLLDRVRQRLSVRGLAGAELEQHSLRAAGLFWISLHGLATLAIAGRLCVLGGELDPLLLALLERVAPD